MNSIDTRASRRTMNTRPHHPVDRAEPAPNVAFSAMLSTLELRRLVAAMVD